MYKLDLQRLFEEDPKKHDELSAFHWFMQAIKADFTGFEMSERPDFVVQLQSKSIGIEITRAERKCPNSSFSLHQIEDAQRKFSERLLDNIDPKIPIEVGLMLEDGVAVDKVDFQKASDIISPLIDRISADMVPHSVELIVRKESDLARSTHRKHVYPELPNFIQHIQLYNDGHKISTVSCCGGCFLDHFTDNDLMSILDKKHTALVGYKPSCDEHWLVIVSGPVPPLFVEHKSPPVISISSLATAFWGVDLLSPVESNFARVYFFKGPGEAVLLTKPIIE